MTQTKEDNSREDSLDNVETAESKISNFAAKLGQDVGDNYQVYIYRIVKDEESGRTKTPFVKKYIGIEPDPQEIAEKFRFGTYRVQFIWYLGKKQQSKAYTLDIDEAAFPALPKQSTAIVPYAGNPNLSEAMQLQAMTISAITDVMKSAYASGNNSPGRAVVQQDPLEMFSGLMETMEGSFARAMAIQSSIMERVFTRNMEDKYGLGAETTQPAQPGESAEETGLIGKYAPIVREIVEGIKTVMGFFGGEVPQKVVDKVKSNDRFKALLADPKSLLVVGSALRKEFGDQKAQEIMNSFGVRMVIKDRSEVHRTPDMPGIHSGSPRASATTPGSAAAPALPAPKQKLAAEGRTGGRSHKKRE
jgi:hypothetical protein